MAGQPGLRAARGGVVVWGGGRRSCRSRARAAGCGHARAFRHGQEQRERRGGRGLTGGRRATAVGSGRRRSSRSAVMTDGAEKGDEVDPAR